MTDLDAALDIELKTLRRRLDRIEHGGRINGTVISADPTNAQVTMRIVGADGSIQDVKFPVATNFVPEPGSTAVVTVNGQDPLVIPLNGQTVAVDGSWLRSPNYVAGVSGWKIDADGSAEFNNVVVRGILEASTIKKSSLVFSEGNADDVFLFNDLANGDFDVNINGWTGFNCTLSRVTTPVQSGAGALALTTGGPSGAATATSPEGTSGFLVTPGWQYTLTAYARSSVASRTAFFYIRFYNAAGTVLTTWAVNGWVGTFTGVTLSTSAYTGYTWRGTAPPTAVYGAVQYWVQTPTGAGEIYYLDNIHVTSAAFGYNWDADPIGIGTGTEAVNTNATTLPPGYTSGSGLGFGSTGTAGRYPNVGVIHSCLGNTAYTFSSIMFASNPALVRIYAAWYTSTGVLLSVDKDIQPQYADNTAAYQLEATFQSPATATIVMFGVMADIGITLTASWISLASIDMSLTTNFASGYLDDSVAATVRNQTPPGTIISYPGSVLAALMANGREIFSVPGYLLADESNVSRTRYSRLFAAIGTTFGVGDGSTTFTLPPKTRWKTFTPTWDSSAHNVSLGNGTLAGRYYLIGATCHFAIILQFGSTTNGGSGTYSFALPFLSDLNFERQAVAKAFVTGGFNFQGIGYIPGNSTLVYPYFSTSATDCRLLPARNSNTGAVGEGQPLVAGNYPWTNGTNLTITGSYEVAAAYAEPVLIKI